MRRVPDRPWSRTVTPSGAPTHVLPAPHPSVGGPGTRPRHSDDLQHSDGDQRPGRLGPGSSRPVVLRVAAGHLLADLGPRAGPEAGEVGGDLDRPVGRRQQGQRAAAPVRRRRSGARARRTGPARAPTPSAARPRSRSRTLAPGRQRPASAGPARRARRRAATAAATRSSIAEVEAVEVGRDPVAPTRYGASHSSSVAEQRAVGPVGPGVAERDRRRNADPGPQLRAPPASTAARRAASPAPVDERRGRRRRRRVGRRDLLAEPQRVEAPLDALDEVVAVGVPLQPAIARPRRRQRGDPRRRRRAAPRRMRAPDRLPSRSAATTNGTVASGSSSATHAPAPVRSWNWPGRRGGRRAGRGSRASRAAPARVGVDGVERRSGCPARRARSAARSRTRATARRSARSSRPCPHDQRDPQREVGRELVGAAAQHVALVDDRGDDARQRRRGRRRRPSGPGGGARAGRASPAER